MNATLIELAASSAPLVIETTTRSNWFQFAVSITVTLMVGLWFLLHTINTASLGGIGTRYRMRRLTGRPTMMLKHTKMGLFSQDMIDQKTLDTTIKFLNKHSDKEVNIILHTPGGSIFHSMALSKAIKSHGKVHVYVPIMAMSGGTLLSLSSYKLHMSTIASLGPVDPQLGLIWTQGSADDWKTVIKKKGVKAGDTAYIMNNEGKKYTKLIADHFKMLGLKKSVVEELTNGAQPHGVQYGYMEVFKWGINLELLHNEELSVCIKGVT